MTSSKMSTYTVKALEPYTHVIYDYAYAVYSWSRALHLFIRTRLIQYWYDLYGFGWKQHKNKLSIPMIHVPKAVFVRVSVCK